MNEVQNAKLIAIFRTKRDVNHWLSQPCQALGGETPECWIRKGKEEEVINVAQRDLGYYVNYD
jgi:hypothetical protein